MKRLRGAEVIMGAPILAVKREYDEAGDGATVTRPLLRPQRGVAVAGAHSRCLLWHAWYREAGKRS